MFRKHVKPKKQHEIARMSELADKLHLGRPRRLVDVGSGVGHLSRLLAHGRRFSVVCADAEADFTASANKFDSDLMRVASSAKFREEGKDIGHPPKHLTYILRPDARAEDLDDKLRRTFEEEERKDDFQ